MMGLTGIDSDHTSHLGHDIDILDIMRLGLKKKSSFCNFVHVSERKHSQYLNFLREKKNPAHSSEI